MKESLQLRIPTPCGEDWEHMQPAEKGRHCEHCCKTVVDFTEMSDEEIIRYVTERPSGVCGRLMPDQLGRELTPAAVQRNGWSGWRWVLAGLVMVSKGSESRRAVKPAVEVRAPKGDTGRKDDRGEVFTGKLGYSIPVVVGDTVITVRPGRAEMDEVAIALRQERDSVQMGTPAIVRMDSASDPAGTIPVTVPSAIQPLPQRELVGYAGGIVVGVCIKKTPIDTVTDFLKKAVVDTLTALNILPKNELMVYPNPVARGGALQLAWQMEPGKYQLTLLNVSGALVEQRLLEVAGKGQVDQWVVPVGLAAGVYFLRVVKEGGADVYIREILVR
ncbi:MAG TPA: T9SS type A sorting domain-containing protein [Puia sp.]|nr:T9SS type A sorting domain-containing protein [Puia sp.]